MTWIRKISVQDPAHYGAVFNLLSNNTMFNLVLEDTNERIMNSSPMSATSAPEPDFVMADDPECPMPYIPNDPNALIRPHFENLQIPCAWSVTRGDANITVGVVDLRFDPFNTDLQGKILNNPGCQATDIETNGRNQLRLSLTNSPDLQTDPDGAGVGLDDLDGDGYFDDLPGDQSLTVVMEFTPVPSEMLACGSSSRAWLRGRFCRLCQ